MSHLLLLLLLLLCLLLCLGDKHVPHSQQRLRYKHHTAYKPFCAPITLMLTQGFPGGLR
jgi:hypothetical protein